MTNKTKPKNTRDKRQKVRHPYLYIWSFHVKNNHFKYTYACIITKSNKMDKWIKETKTEHNNCIIEHNNCIIFPHMTSNWVNLTAEDLQGASWSWWTCSENGYGPERHHPEPHSAAVPLLARRGRCSPAPLCGRMGCRRVILYSGVGFCWIKLLTGSKAAVCWRLGAQQSHLTEAAASRNSPQCLQKAALCPSGSQGGEG